MASNKPAETFLHGVRRAWLDSNRIALIITHDDTSHQAIDAWADLMMRSIQDWPLVQPVQLMLDLSHPKQTVTIYSLKRLEDVYATFTDEQAGHVAVILGNGIVNSMISRLLRRHRGKGCLQERIFTNREDAYNWLKQSAELPQPQNRLAI